MVDVVAVEGQSRLEAQRVARAEADRLATALHERLPDGDRVCRRDEELEPIFTGVARAGGGDVHAGEFGIGESEARHLGESAAAQAIAQLDRARALHGDEGKVSTAVLDVAQLGGVLAEVGDVFFDVRGVDDDAIVLGPKR